MGEFSNMIETVNLRKEYEFAPGTDEGTEDEDSTVALENLTLNVPEGEVMGLIGPNGAGKTTLIRILSTLLEPTFGQVRIGGIDALENPLEVHPLIGYMSDFFSLYEDLLVWEYLDHFARCYGITRNERPVLVDEMLELVDLKEKKETGVKFLSRGMKQRLCLAKTILHRPDLLILDEPASGLDPAARLMFREIIRKLHEMGQTILISSHILTEMTDFCTSVAIIEKGQLLECGRVDEVVKKLNHGLRLTIEVLDDSTRLHEVLEHVEHVRQIEFNDRVTEFRFFGSKEDLPELHRLLVQADIPVVSFEARSDDTGRDLHGNLTTSDFMSPSK